MCRDEEQYSCFDVKGETLDNRGEKNNPPCLRPEVFV